VPDYFFLSSYTAIFKPTILFEPVFQPASFSYGYGKKETPLFVLGIKQNDITVDLMEQDPAALSLQNKVSTSI
jgi:hypothetical protein